MADSTLTIQAALQEAGYNPGPIDGIRGRRTIRAVKAFQRAHGLQVDGIVGPLTAAALFRNELFKPQDIAPWYAEAERLQGTKEVAGRGSNPVIMDWAEALDLDYPDDDVPWCGLFVGHCIASQLPDEPIPTRLLTARAWTGFGRETSPRTAAVLVFWRGSRAGWQGHVGFYAGEDASAYHVLGGNQSNQVTIARVAKNRLLGAYWPVTAGPATTPTRRLDVVQSPLSLNEV